jgi:hypothetical protein
MKKFHTGCLLLGTILLAILVWKVSFKELWRELALLGWGLLPLILLEGVADLFHTRGWRHCLSDPHRSLPFFQLYGIRLVGFSINYLTPTATLGGELTKGTLLYSNHRGPQAASGIIIDKLSYALTQLILVVLGSFMILWKIPLTPALWAAVLTGTSLLGAGIIGFLVVQKYGKLGTILRWLAAHRVGGKSLENFAHHITQVDNELKLFYKERPLALPYSMVWHAVGMACGIGQSWLFFSLLTDHASITMAAGVWFLGTWFDLISFALPVNIGVFEGTRIVAFRLLGFSSALGLTYGIALRIEQLFWAGAGLLAYAAFMFHASKKEKEKEFFLKKAGGEALPETMVSPTYRKEG